MAVSPDGKGLAAEVRLNLYDYTIAVNGIPWQKTFGCVWEPFFHPVRGSVLAPVRTQGLWTLAEDGEIIWQQRFVQLWHASCSPDGSRLAAIVAPKFGRWTVAVEGVPWSATFGEMVNDLVFSPNGQHIAATVKDNGRWSLAVDGRRWQNTFDMVGKPVFSEDGRYLAVKGERNGRYTIAVNDQLWSSACDAAWDPVFDSTDEKILLKTIEAGTYRRRVLPVAQIVR
jgi:hypothetical protein